MSKQLIIRTRIAPSPTGEDLHIGNVYTALFNFAWAKKHDGKFIVRIEDTDQTRKVEGSEKKILESLAWFGLHPDEKVVRQSERLDLYNQYARELVKKGHAYICTCSTDRLAQLRKDQQRKKQLPRYDGKCRNSKLETRNSKLKNYVIRMKVPNSGTTSFTDIIRGKISIENKILDDQVILKSDGFPTYHLAVVVDDHLMKISHIIRAEEWISSTPKHVLLYGYLGWKLPKFAHVPILRNPDKSKLSKRRNPVWISSYRKDGFLPEAILNYLATLGWAPSYVKTSEDKHPEIFSLKEFIEEFDLKDIQTTSPVFDITKLEWMNGEYIRKTQNSKLKDQVIEYLKKRHPVLSRHSGLDPESIKSHSTIIKQTIPLIQTRIKKLSEYWPMCEFFFKRPKEYEGKINKDWLEKSVNTLESLGKWNHEAMYRKLSKDSESFDVSKSKYFMNIRIAITGKKVGPPLFESMEILGKKESIDRIKSVLLRSSRILCGA